MKPTLQIANDTGQPYTGWVPISTAHAADLEGGIVPGKGAVIVPGRSVGRKGRMVHVHAKVEPGETLVLETDDLEPLNADSIPPTPQEILGNPQRAVGWPVLDDLTLRLESLTEDGPGYLAHFSGRLSAMLQAELWVQWYPAQPWAQIELCLLASNSQSSELGARLDRDLHLTWAPGHVQIRGLPMGAPLLPAGTWIGDGQGRAWVGTVVWTDRLTDWDSAGAWTEGPILGQGDWSEGAFGPLGYPAELPPHFDVNGWVARHLPDALGALHTWNRPQLGWAANSGDTGGQEDQGWTKCSETFAPGGVGAWWVRYLVALSWIKRPCHHLEPDGSPLDLDGHPDLVLGPGRVHWHTGVSPDRLGIPPGSRIDWHGWNGPDRQHWFINTLGAARMLSGSPLLGYLLHHQAINYWFNQTVEAGKVTSGPGADRGVGWTCITAAWILEGLDAGPLYERIRQRVVDRANLVLVPQLDRSALTVQRWSTTNDPRVIGDLTGYTRAWMAYQLAVGAGGAQILGEYLSHDGLREVARQGADAVVNYAYTHDDASGRWLEWEYVGEREDGVPIPDSEYVEGQGAHRTGWFSNNWFPFASWALLRHEPDNQRAKAIYDQIRSGMMADDKPLDWLPPLK